MSDPHAFSEARAQWLAEMDGLNVAISAHPGMRARTLWDEIVRSLNIFERNALELTALLAEVETNAQLQMTVFAQPGSDSDNVRTDYYQQLDQRLANFVSSLAALIDHTRRAMSSYAGSALAEEFAERNGLVRDMPSAGFLRQLRNMLLHRGGAPLGVRLHLQGQKPRNPSEPAAALELDCERLLEWDRWRASDKEYIRAAEPSVRLLDPVAATYFGIKDLYYWLGEAVNTWHADDFAAVNALISRTHEMSDRGAPA
jgi:hypothetical protein